MYNSNGTSFYQFKIDPISKEWFGDFNFFRGSGKNWYKDIFVNDISSGKLKFYKTENLSLSQLLAFESERGKDFTGEGVVGDKISKVLTNGSGQKGFYKLSSDYILLTIRWTAIGSSPQNQVSKQKIW